MKKLVLAFVHAHRVNRFRYGRRDNGCGGGRAERRTERSCRLLR